MLDDFKTNFEDLAKELESENVGYDVDQHTGAESQTIFVELDEAFTERGNFI